MNLNIKLQEFSKLNSWNVEHRTLNVQRRIRNSVNLKQHQAGRTHPAAFICHEESDSAEIGVGYFAHDLIDKAQLHQYWTFDVGRSVFDVHPFLSSI